MLLNPQAVEKLKVVTAYYWPPTTHRWRNGLAQMFIQEAGRLLDQKAESTIKHAVELYSQGEISHERYNELIEQVSSEEAIRGAAQGGEYARNRAFDFAQKALDKEKERMHTLSLFDARKQYELEKQKTEQLIKDTTSQCIDDIKSSYQQYEDEKKKGMDTLQETVDISLQNLKQAAQQQRHVLMLDHDKLVESTKTQIEQVVTVQLRSERAVREKEIHEQENLRPARDAARVAIARVSHLEKQRQRYIIIRTALIVISIALFVAVAVTLLLVALPAWVFVLFLVIAALLFGSAYLWRGTFSEDQIAINRREVALFQTGGGDYAALSEEERCEVLVQKLL